VPPSRIDLLLPDGLTAERLAELLAPHADVAPDGHATRQRIYLDTFDGRVRGSGHALVHEAGRLVLETDAGERVAAADWPAAPSALGAADLPDGPLRWALAPLLDVRRATRTARVRVRTRGLRVLDDERKTVVRLELLEPALPKDGGDLAARLRIGGVRGYDRELARVRAVLGEELGLAEAAEPLVDEAVARAGGRPHGVSSRLDVELVPDQRADAAAVAVARRLLEVLEANLPGTLADTDTEFLHDLRVAVRRTRALQRELRGVFPPERLRAHRAAFRELQQVTGPVRDLDVQLLEFDDVAATLPEPQRRDLEPLRGVLAATRARERARMVRALRSRRTRDALDAWRAELDGLQGTPEADRPDAAQPIAGVAARRIARVHRSMVRMGRAIGDDTPPEALHELRKKGKELRYLLEFFARLFPAATVDPTVKALKALQDTLGRFQDREVQAHALRDLGDDVAVVPGGPAALMAMGVLTGRLGDEQAQARTEFAERFARFAAPDRRAAVRETFG
jgi:CHAD domain-containing protein